MKRVVIVVMVLLIALLPVVSLASGSLTPNIKAVMCLIVPNGNLVCIFENTSDIVVPDFEATFLFKDASGTIVYTEHDGHDAVLPHSQVVSICYTSIKPSDFSSIVVNIDADKYTNDYVNHADDLDIQTNLGKDCVIAQITNHSDVTIQELETVVVFYQGDRIVGAREESQYDIASGSSVILQYNNPYDHSYDNIKYDSYKLFINQAHTF